MAGISKQLLKVWLRLKSAELIRIGLETLPS
jgi:hypothetical protein